MLIFLQKSVFLQMKSRSGLNCGRAPLWVKLTGKVPVMVIPPCPNAPSPSPLLKASFRKIQLVFDIITSITMNNSLILTGIM